MSRDLFQNRFLIPSARAAWHNYDGGMYFVTICTGGREHYFGEITNGEMRLSEIGRYTDECIKNIPQHNLYATVPLYVIMPNHIHLIVVIDDVPSPVETVHAPSQTAPFQAHAPSQTTPFQKQQQSRWLDENVNEKMQTISQRKNKLSFAIGNFKSAVTKFANQNQILFSWQTRFHDHIIRKTDEMNRIAEYIETNVLRWESDEFYS